MIVEQFVLDSRTFLALGGNKQVSGLIHVASGDPTVCLWVPVLCALEAERERAGIIDYLGILDVLHTLDADYATAHTLARLHHRGIALGTEAAVHAARTTLDRPPAVLSSLRSRPGTTTVWGWRSSISPASTSGCGRTSTRSRTLWNAPGWCPSG